MASMLARRAWVYRMYSLAWRLRHFWAHAGSMCAANSVYYVLRIRLSRQLMLSPVEGVWLQDSTQAALAHCTVTIPASAAAAIPDTSTSGSGISLIVWHQMSVSPEYHNLV